MFGLTFRKVCKTANFGLFLRPQKFTPLCQEERGSDPPPGVGGGPHPARSLNTLPPPTRLSHISAAPILLVKFYFSEKREGIGPWWVGELTPIRSSRSFSPGPWVQEAQNNGNRTEISSRKEIHRKRKPADHRRLAEGWLLSPCPRLPSVSLSSGAGHPCCCPAMLQWTRMSNQMTMFVASSLVVVSVGFSLVAQSQTKAREFERQMEKVRLWCPPPYCCQRTCLMVPSHPMGGSLVLGRPRREGVGAEGAGSFFEEMVFLWMRPSWLVMVSRAMSARKTVDPAHLSRHQPSKKISGFAA